MSYKLFIYTSLICALVLTVQSCEKEEIIKVKPEFALEQADHIDDEDYQIYSLFIEESYISKQVVIRQNSDSSPFLLSHITMSEYLIDNGENFDTSLIRIHAEANKSSVNFGEHFQSDSKEIVLITQEEISYFFGDIGYDEFYYFYENSNGIVEFSRIAYNEGRTQAAFQVTRHHYNGSIVHLEKVNGNWAIKKVKMVWTA